MIPLDKSPSYAADSVVGFGASRPHVAFIPRLCYNDTSIFHFDTFPVTWKIIQNKYLFWSRGLLGVFWRVREYVFDARIPNCKYSLDFFFLFFF